MTDVTLPMFWKALSELNVEEKAVLASTSDIVRLFNAFVENHYSHATYKERLAVLC